MQRVVRPKHRDRDFLLRRALLLADWLGLWLALAFAMAVAGRRQPLMLDSLWILPTLPAWAILFRIYGLYQRPIRRFEPTHLDDLGALFHSLVIGTLGLWLFYKLLPIDRLSLPEVALFGVTALVLIAGLRVATRVRYLRSRGPEKVFAIAPPEHVAVLRRMLENHPEYEMELVGSMGADGCKPELDLPLNSEPGDLEALIEAGKVDHVVAQFDSRFLAQDELVELMRVCHREGIRFGAFPREQKLLLPGVEVNHLEGLGFLSYHPPVLSRTSRLMKRSFDVAVSAILLCLLSPLLAAIAVATKFSSPRDPVLFRQPRVGRDGTLFDLFKFRTMEPEAEKRTEELMAQSNDPDWLILERDPRVTRMGRFLRRASLDELPQLWNVLKGEMSLVGPRPLSVLDDAAVRGWGRNRLDFTPGITGYWQVLGRNNIPFKEMLEIDYAYISSWSLALDLKLLLRTIPVVVGGRGAN